MGAMGAVGATGATGAMGSAGATGAAGATDTMVAVSLELDSRTLRAYQRMAADLRRVFGDRFIALVAGRAGAGAVFAREIRTDDLEAMGALASTWHHEGVATPLLMTPGEFERSLD